MSSRYTFPKKGLGPAFSVTISVLQNRTACKDIRLDARGTTGGERGEHFMRLKSDKKARLYMCVDSNLLSALDASAKVNGLSLEDEVEQILYQAAKRRLELLELFSVLTTEQRIFILGYAKGLSDENEWA